MILLATLAWSFAGLLTRMLSIDVATAVALRALAGGLFLFAYWLIRRRRAAFSQLVGVGRVGWIVVLLSIVAQAATTAGLFLTSVAHVSVIYATCPFVAALIAKFWLGEAIPRMTAIAILASICGVVLAVAGATGSSTLLGDAVAFLMTISFAIIIVLSKAYPGLKILEITILGALFTFLLFLPFSSTKGLDAWNIGVVTVYGFSNMVLAYLLFLKGARYVSAATSGLIVTLEIALSPYWVWLFFGEKIDTLTFIGGIIVTAAVAGHLVLMSSRPARHAHT
ncbi:DMT family transporter [Dongia soli]|uniref:DMT family transporter n=1 Tax=Dongia soli TaxID=600628 RepID=A0ABU5EDE0_9PROT|nr:DMT family transporter [Dongia soli]MDY0883458.1 DMT family transporter [Dongia soli]